LKNRQIGIPILKFGIPKKIDVGTQYTSFHTRKTVAAIPTSTQNGCHHTYIYSTPVAAIPTSTQRRLPPYLHLLNACPAIPTSTQSLSRHTYIHSMPAPHTYIYSTPVPSYLHLLNPGCRYTYIYSKKSRNVFGFMKLEELMAGEDSELAGMCSKLAGTHFTIRKI
jgi:hypothetical protein